MSGCTGRRLLPPVNNRMGARLIRLSFSSFTSHTTLRPSVLQRVLILRDLRQILHPRLHRNPVPSYNYSARSRKDWERLASPYFPASPVSIRTRVSPSTNVDPARHHRYGICRVPKEQRSSSRLWHLPSCS